MTHSASKKISCYVNNDSIDDDDEDGDGDGGDDDGDNGGDDDSGDDDDNNEDCDEKKGFWYLTIKRGELSGFPESPDWLFDSVGIRILDKEGIKFGQRHIHNSPIRLFIPTITAMTKGMI